MKREELKNGDVVCFEWDKNELIIGLVISSDCDVTVIDVSITGFQWFHIRNTPLFKIGEI